MPKRTTQPNNPEQNLLWIETDAGFKYLKPEKSEAFLGLVRAGKIVSQNLDKSLQANHGLSLHEFEVLLFLTIFAEEQQMSINQLTEQAPLSQSRVSRLVTGLEKKGLVQRFENKEDGRGILVKTTKKGTKLFTLSQETHLKDLNEQLFQRLTEEEIQQLASITSKIVTGE